MKKVEKWGDGGVGGLELGGGAGSIRPRSLAPAPLRQSSSRSLSCGQRSLVQDSC